jgi:hypothetical protein
MFCIFQNFCTHICVYKFATLQWSSDQVASLLLGDRFRCSKLIWHCHDRQGLSQKEYDSYIYIYIIYKHKTQTDTCVQTRRHEFPYCRHLLLNLAKMVVHDLACFDNFRNMDLHLVCNQNNPWWSQLPPEWCLVVPI